MILIDYYDKDEKLYTGRLMYETSEGMQIQTSMGTLKFIKKNKIMKVGGHIYNNSQKTINPKSKGNHKEDNNIKD